MTTVTVKKAVSKLDTVITEKEYNSLKSMLESKDEGDHKIAQAILNQCNVEKSIYWIWRLADRHASRMVYLRTKASREFRDSCDLFGISYKDNYSFLKWLARRQWLTPEIFSYVKEDLLKELKCAFSDRNFFHNIHVELKEDFKHLDTNDSLIHLNKESQL